MSKTGTLDSTQVEERFGELFKAARLLLKEGVTEEDLISHEKVSMAMGYRTFVSCLNGLHVRHGTDKTV